MNFKRELIRAGSEGRQKKVLIPKKPIPRVSWTVLYGPQQLVKLPLVYWNLRRLEVMDALQLIWFMSGLGFLQRVIGWIWGEASPIVSGILLVNPWINLSLVKSRISTWKTILFPLEVLIYEGNLLINVTLLLVFSPMTALVFLLMLITTGINFDR